MRERRNRVYHPDRLDDLRHHRAEVLSVALTYGALWESE